MANADNAALRAISEGRLPDDAEARSLLEIGDPGPLMEPAEELTRAGHGERMTFSKKVFIPLTRLCRDVCHYCTFANPPRRGEPAYLSREDVLAVAEAGRAAGCKEALFTLGDKPELRYRAAREALAALGHEDTLGYLQDMSRAVLAETGLLPHLNPGVMDEIRIARLRAVSVSQGLMLESVSTRLLARGGAHHGSPDKDPEARLATIRAAGRARVPFTTGLLIGIGETRAERIDALLALRQIHAEHGHLQEIIIQNFRAKPGTRMAAAPEPDLDEHLWTIAAARLIFGSGMNIQAPPNLRPGALERLVRAGLNDWGGVSPVTPDHVNPEAPWPNLANLAEATARAGRTLVERLAIYPEYARDAASWVSEELRTPLLRARDTGGLAREDGWSAGDTAPPPAPSAIMGNAGRPMARILDRLAAGVRASEADIVTLFGARGPDFRAVTAAADRLRRTQCGDVVSFVVNRNINYTNVCTYGCSFCAFSKGRLSQGLRDTPYDLTPAEVGARAAEAAARGATEVCLQGGIRAGMTGKSYLAILEAVRMAAPEIHIHAFSPLEVWHGATSLGLGLRPYLEGLAAAGLKSLPGTAAEILDDEVRRLICPDKVTTAQWLEVMETAHDLGIPSTATIMFGHVDGYQHWARHLLAVRDLQARTGGFTEFVPLPFVHMEAPIYLRGNARPGPTWREAVLMHAVARLVLHPLIGNIQASWVKMGPAGAATCLSAGANDIGGTLMNESITRAAGAAHGQEMTPPMLEALIIRAGRIPRQRTTFYGPAPSEEEFEPALRPRLVAAE